MSVKRFAMATLFLALSATPSLAHPGHGNLLHFVSGFDHPLTGIDHILAMVAVGLYASQLGGRNLLLVPLAFVGTMIAGGLAGYSGLPLPMVEQGISLSVIAMGLAIAFGIRLPTAFAMGLVATFALFHGHAHGQDGVGLGVSFIPYAVGFVVATTALHIAGIALGLGLKRLETRPALLFERLAGTGAVVAGVALFTGWLVA